jgi:YfiH family protein
VTKRLENPEATGEGNDLLSSVGLGHGQRVDLVRAAGWQRYAWLRHGFSTRTGGVSTVYDSGGSQDQGAAAGSLNMGWTRQDKAANVAENRRRFMAEVAGAPVQTAATSSSGPANPCSQFPVPCLVTLHQFHYGTVHIVESEDLAQGLLQTADGRAVLRGDGLMTNLRGVFLGIQTADCVPILVADVRRRAVAAFHAGWRGTLARIVERGIGTMRLRYGSRPQDMVAVVGPSIGPCCYAVGEEVRHEFESQFAYAREIFSKVYDSNLARHKRTPLFLSARTPGHSNIGPQIHLDLWEANRRQLLDAGVPARRIQVIGECTACTGLGTANGRKYFSHRAESGFTGRMLAAIGVA